MSAVTMVLDQCMLSGADQEGMTILATGENPRGFKRSRAVHMIRTAYIVGFADRATTTGKRIADRQATRAGGGIHLEHTAFAFRARERLVLSIGHHKIGLETGHRTGPGT